MSDQEIKKDVDVDGEDIASPDKKKKKTKKKKEEEPQEDVEPEPRREEPSRPTSKRQEVPMPVFDEPLDKICVHHGLTLVYFCESCEEPICESCTIHGPHNNQLHRINSLDNAFTSRVIAIEEIIEKSMIGKRDKLIAQIHRVDYRVEEVKSVKTLIERDLRAEFAGMLERLKSAEGGKLAVLQHDIAELQRDIDKINDLIHTVNSLTAKSTDPREFLLRSKHINEAVEFLLAKPFKVDIGVVPYDLPRELPEQRFSIEKLKTSDKVIEFKDKVIAKFATALYDQKEQELSKQKEIHLQEVVRWVELTENLNKQLQNYQSCCYYCGVVMDVNSANSVCEINFRPGGLDKIDGKIENPGFTVQKPTNQNGTRRHFFGDPRPELVSGQRFTIIKPDRLLEKSPMDTKKYRYHFILSLRNKISSF